MSKILFTDKQIKSLSKNKYIKNITSRVITYEDEFKLKLVKECEDFKKFPQQVFRECGLDPDIIGIYRIQSSANRWRTQYKKIGDIRDTRKTNTTGRPRVHEMSEREKLKRAEAKIRLLEAENELLKKNELIEMGIIKDIKSISNMKL